MGNNCAVALRCPCCRRRWLGLTHPDRPCLVRPPGEGTNKQRERYALDVFVVGDMEGGRELWMVVPGLRIPVPVAV